jgi:oleate hydratase
MSKSRKAFMVGGGIGSLASAAFMIRDGGMLDSNITILEACPNSGEAWMVAELPTLAIPCVVAVC